MHEGDQATDAWVWSVWFEFQQIRCADPKHLRRWKRECRARVSRKGEDEEERERKRVRRRERACEEKENTLSFWLLGRLVVIWKSATTLLHFFRSHVLLSLLLRLNSPYNKVILLYLYITTFSFFFLVGGVSFNFSITKKPLDWDLERGRFVSMEDGCLCGTHWLWPTRCRSLVELGSTSIRFHFYTCWGIEISHQWKKSPMLDIWPSPQTWRGKGI